MSAVRSLRRQLIRLLVLGALGGASVFTPASAQDYTFRVVNVRPGDWLNIRAGPAASFPIVGRLERSARGVASLGDCVDGWCPLRSGLVLGWSSGRYLAREPIDAEPAMVVEPDTGAAEEPGVTSTVLPDGTLEISFPDGSKRRRLPSGNIQTVWPNGQTSVGTFVQVPIATLPPLPGELTGWGSQLEESLLNVLKNILTDAEMQAYLQTEEGKTFYELLNWRLLSIQFLTNPGTT